MRPPPIHPQTEIATFAAGCFWGVEQAFRDTHGVIDAEVGYTGGKREDPSYEQVCSGATGHAEAVRVTFDPARVMYIQLLDVFFSIHDPTTRDRQGPDVGSQYRSAIFTHSQEQEDAALAQKQALEAVARHGGKPVVTQIAPAGPFYRAEEHHQRYNEKHGGGACRI